MCAFVCDYTLRIALAMLTIGKVSASTKLTILNNQSDLKCKTMQTVLTCELQKPLEWSMYWWVDNSRVSECNTSSCDRKDGMPTNYNTTVTNVGNVFKLYIDPVDIFDNKTFTCTDGDVSNGIRITTEEVKMNKLLTTFTNKTVDNNVVFNVTTNCVFHPSAVNLSLESKKVNGNGGFTSFPVNITNKTTVCSNTENAYCGGNKTKKLNLNFPISTDTKGGEMHQFRLHLIQTLENGTNHTITFEIGQLKLPVNDFWPVYVQLFVLAGLCALVPILCLCYKCDVRGLRSYIRRNTTRRKETTQEGTSVVEVDSSNSNSLTRTNNFRTCKLEQGTSLTRRSLRRNKKEIQS